MKRAFWCGIVSWVLGIGFAGAAPAMPGIRVDVGGYALHLYCVGSGAPVVVMDSALGGTYLDWARVQPQVARFTKACSYDRAGYGWSDLSPLPRTSRNIALELHILLQRAGVKGPYVLVGHSFGGLNVQLYARIYPCDTAGLVLVDASNDQQVQRFQQEAGVNTAPQSGLVLLGTSPPFIPPGIPSSLQPLVREFESKPSYRIAVRSELAAFRQSAAELTHAPALPDVPYVVVSRGKPAYPETDEGRKMEQVWQALQNDLASRSSRALHLIAKRSGHFIQLEQPEIVTDAIRDAIAQAKPGSRLCS